MNSELPEHPETLIELEKWISDGVEESLTLDYKAAAALAKNETAEIAKDVSAMANAAGGVLIYGVTEREKPQAHLPAKIDPVNGSNITKEWLEHVIGSGIQPRIPGVIVKPIRLVSPPDGVVYVVLVPQGTTAHQATAKQKYYRRYNFQSVPMLDHEIRDVMHRVSHPQVRLSLKVSEGEAQSALGLPPLGMNSRRFFWLDVAVFNHGERTARNVYAKLLIPAEILAAPDWPVELNGTLYCQFSLDMSAPESDDIVGVVHTPAPLLPKMRRHLKTIQLMESTKPLPEVSLYCSIYADEAPVFREELCLTSLPGEADDEWHQFAKKTDVPR